MQAFVDASNKVMRDNVRKSAEESNEECRKKKEKAQRIETKLQSQQELTKEEESFYENWKIEEELRMKVREYYEDNRKELGPIQKTSENIKGEGVSYYIPDFF